MWIMLRYGLAVGIGREVATVRQRRGNNQHTQVNRDDWSVAVVKALKLSLDYPGYQTGGRPLCLSINDFADGILHNSHSSSLFQARDDGSDSAFVHDGIECNPGRI